MEKIKVNIKKNKLTPDCKKEQKNITILDNDINDLTEIILYFYRK